MRSTQFYVYILTNAHRTVLYTGVTNDLLRRAHQHASGHGRGFTKRYVVTDLVWYEIHLDPRSAIRREKQLKSGSRATKVALIEAMNPTWKDLRPEL